ncbi:hypothetical protein [Pseudoduganella sp. UC29_71]|jgi:uncharacterized membrane protein|uniref:hypothetical protein n=1 Tax=Pseudoduganella sp. UC29_71 TaxID=3350174 RepID=UPI000D300EFF
MLILKVIMVIFVVAVGIPCQLIDYRHRRKNAYVPGHGWSYYSRLKREGSWEGRFMMNSAYMGIALILAMLGLLAAHLFRA